MIGSPAHVHQVTQSQLYRGVLTVDLDALASNFRRLQAAARPAECGATVKADAYGLGLEPVTKRLAREGCRRFYVATLGEGVSLRGVLPQRGYLRVRRRRGGRRGGIAAPRPRAGAELPAADAALERSRTAHRRAPARGAAHRHRHEPPRHERVRDGGARARAEVLRRHRARSRDDASRLRGPAGASPERAADRAVRAPARAPAAGADEHRQLGGDAHGRRVLRRHRASRDRALWRESLRRSRAGARRGRAPAGARAPGARAGARRSRWATARPARCRRARGSRR